MKISFGQSLLQTGSTLEPKSLAEIRNIISEPNSALQQLTYRLRLLFAINLEAYQAMKKKLPYICGSEFENGVRKKTAFLQTTGWVIDIDKMDATVDYGSLSKRLASFPGIVLIYISPSGKGIKALVKLKSPINSVVESETAFKNYLTKLADQLNIESFIDFKTYDVTRVSFLCSDENIWIDEIKQGIDHQDYLPTEQQLPWDKEAKTAGGANSNLTEEIYSKIKLRLQPNSLKPKAANVMLNIPETLWEILPIIIEEALLNELQVEHRTISYGLKLTFRYRHQFADLNLFYGKRGFSIVQTPTKGSQPELLDIGFRIVTNCVNSFNQIPTCRTLQISHSSYSV